MPKRTHLIIALLAILISSSVVAAASQWSSSATSQGTIDVSDTFGNLTPVADAGPDQIVVVNIVVQLDGSGSSDPDGDTLTYSWSENLVNPQVNLLSDATVANPTFIPTIAGIYRFTLVVNDGIEDSFPDTVAVTARTPSEATQDLIDLVESLNLQQGIENSLDSKLEAAQQALSDLNENNDAAAINSLQAFINTVEAQRGNQLTNEQADELIARAQAIIDSLSG